MAGWATFNRIMNPETHEASRRVSEPLGHLCGEVAQFQLDHGRHYVVEQPTGSDLYLAPIWMKVRSHTDTAE
eukprot:6747892-Pyramimonas_sp.AAC.1